MAKQVPPAIEDSRASVIQGMKFELGLTNRYERRQYYFHDSVRGHYNDMALAKPDVSLPSQTYYLFAEAACDFPKQIVLRCHDKSANAIRYELESIPFDKTRKKLNKIFDDMETEGTFNLDSVVIFGLPRLFDVQEEALPETFGAAMRGTDTMYVKDIDMRHALLPRSPLALQTKATAPD